MSKNKYFVGGSSSGSWLAKFSQSRMSALQGVLFTIIEGAGLGEKQEKAVKDLVCTSIWNSWHDAPKAEDDLGEGSARGSSN